jgi:quercetin dioxygenase-like cupin family protein
MTRFLAVLAAVLLCAACAKGTPTNPILPPGVSPTPLQQPQYVGIGRFQELGSVTGRPTFGGVPYVSFVEVHEQPGGAEAHRDVPGFVYAYQGSPVVSQENGETLRQDAVVQGSAHWVDARAQYSNTSSAEDVWYFIGLRSITQRGAPLPYTSAKTLYVSGDLPALPADKQLVYILGYITMDVDGRTSAHSHGGTEVFYVIKGTVALATNDGQRVNLTSGQGASVKPGVVMQLRVVGDQPVQILTLFVTPEGAPWQTNVQTLP